jgi:hypothetical protein
MHPLPSIREMYLNSYIDTNNMFNILKTDSRTKLLEIYIHYNIISIIQKYYIIQIMFPVNYRDYFNLQIPSYCQINFVNRLPNTYLDIGNPDYVCGCKRVDYDSYEYVQVINEIIMLLNSDIKNKPWVKIEDICPNFYKYG